MFLALLLFSIVAAKIPRHKLPLELQRCKYNRNDAIDCVLKYGDGDHDRYLCPEEIAQLKKAQLHVWERVISYLHPSSDIMDHCDADRDGAVSEADFDKSIRTCLHTCEDLTTFFEYICLRADASIPPYVPKKVKCTPRLKLNVNDDV